MLIATVAVVGAASLLVCAVTHACAHIALCKKSPPATGFPPITVFKPVKGADAGLEANLRSIVEQDYPGPVQVIVGAASPDDPALEVAARVRRQHPCASITLISGCSSIALNPKVANLEGMLDVASHDVLLISDSNVRVRASYLRDTVSELQRPGVGLVCSYVAGVGAKSLGGELENAQLNSWVVSAVATSARAGHPVVIGKSMMFRRADLAALGGFSRVADVLGEDYLLGRAFARAGHRVAVCPHIVHAVNDDWSVDRFWSRHLRWAQMRRWIAPHLYALEPLLNPLPFVALLMSLALAEAGSSASASALAWAAFVAFGLKIAAESALSRRMLGRWPSAAGLVAIPLKDFFVAAIWFVGWFQRSVSWRGQVLRIGPGSRLRVWRDSPTESPTIGSTRAA